MAIILTTGIVPVETECVEMAACRTCEGQARVGRVERVVNIQWLACVKSTRYAFASLIEEPRYGHRAGHTAFLELNWLRFYPQELTKQRLADLGETLKTQVVAVQDSEAFKRYLSAQAVFHRYSARNVFLILYQMPEATRVAGYTIWQKLGRQVRRGERGITIFAPAPFKQTTTDAASGEVREEIIPRFKTVTVFDISQTEGEVLPSIKLTDVVGNAPAGVYDVLVDFAASIGCMLVPHPEDDDAEGRCNYERQNISVAAASPVSMLHTLIHELAHALTAGIRQAHDRTERETITEGVAFVVSAAIGLDAGGYSFPYIAGYAGQKDGAAIITRLMDTIQKTAAVIIETIETRLVGQLAESEATLEAVPHSCALSATTLVSH